ncbi:hypothetical protein [Peristeroidobacter soli]|uniref:hypothetical protein n=1 Tax=Peristeroidobacter soli TaxID=2497877 RepID=UPI00101C6A6E|nr:hypothetical protein [Peristeroidobacter soli]
MTPSPTPGPMTAQATLDGRASRRRGNDAFISGCDRIDRRDNLIARAENAALATMNLQYRQRLREN